MLFSAILLVVFSIRGREALEDLPRAAASEPRVPRDHFQQQVEDTLSPDTRQQLRVSFSTSPPSAIFALGATERGWFTCQETERSTSRCTAWLITFPNGTNQTIAANEAALLAAIATWRDAASGGGSGAAQGNA